MFLDKLRNLGNLSESAHIGEELLEDSAVSALERKCLVVKQVVQDGDFPLEKALSLYQVSLKDFEQFMAKHLASELKLSLSTDISNKILMVVTIDVVAEMYKHLVSTIDKDSGKIIEHFNTLSKSVNEGRIAV